MWVCRCGNNDKYSEMIFDSNVLFLPWENYLYDLERLNSMEDFRELVRQEKAIENHTSVSNWAGQLYAFSKKISKGDFVIIPQKKTRQYHLVRIIGDYKYLENSPLGLHHLREFEVICCNIPKDIFPQNIQYALGAFRTLFQVKQESEILALIKEWKKEAKK